MAYASEFTQTQKALAPVTVDEMIDENILVRLMKKYFLRLQF